MELYCFGSNGVSAPREKLCYCKGKKVVLSIIHPEKTPEYQVKPELWGRRRDKDVVVSGLVFLLS